MVKIKSIVIVLIAFSMITLTSSSIFAASLTNITYNGSKVTVEGTCTGNQAQVAIFNSNKEPVYFTTVESKNGKFNSTLTASFNFEEGKTYTVKVADYDGTEMSTKTFIAEKIDLNEKDETPKTGNNVYIYTVFVVIAMAGFSIASKLMKKSK